MTIDQSEARTPTPTKPPRPWYRKKRFWALGGVIVLFGIAAVAGDPEKEGEQASATSSTSTTAEAGGATTAPTSAPTTTAPPTTQAPGFGEGTKLVGSDIQPGRYISNGSGCYWERLSGLDGELDSLLANGNVDGQAIVEVLPTDVAFNSNRCGRWTIYAPPTAPAATFGDGDWAVGQQIQPGRYRSSESDCYWERASGFTHQGVDELLANDNASGQAIVEIQPSDARFTSSRCGTWTKV